MIKALKKLSYTQIIVLSFLLVIVTGTILLCLPVATKSGTPTPPLNALFTATSATCVTGLVLYDTFSYWSLFGQIVIISLIQVGGLGFLAFIAMFLVFFKKKIGVYERRLLMQAQGNLKLSGMVTLLKLIVKGTFLIEGIGAVILATRFVPKMGWAQGIYNAMFHSVSAFCNAGFDLMGKYSECSSLITFNKDPVVIMTIASLIAIGGIGFLVWSDVLKFKTKLRKYSLHSKIVLFTTSFLILVPTVLFLIFEAKGVLAEFTPINKITNALMLAISPRTAGFNSVDLTQIAPGTELIIDSLMLIGGSPGSTAGGFKTTTFAIIVLYMIATARHDTHPQIFKRRLPDDALRDATAVFAVYVFAAFSATVIICTVEGIDIPTVTFEVVSAIGTVGLSKGITSTLGGISKIVLISLMFGGRVGGLSFILSLAEKKNNVPIDRPQEKILIG